MGKKKSSEVSVKKIRASDSLKSAAVDRGADLYVKTGLTEGRRFLVKIENVDAKPTLIAVHL